MKLSHISKNIIFGYKSAGNQRVRFVSTLVGTSETTRVTQVDNNFCDWLAGLIDGDGCLLISQKRYASLEITMDIKDLKCLKYIQNKLGGSVKLRSGSNSYRFRLHNKPDVLNLLNLINGRIRHSTRLNQLHRVCQLYSIPLINPTKLTSANNWFTGFFDADGTIVIRSYSNIGGKEIYPLLSIRVTNKLLQDVESYKDVFGGNIYYDSSQNGYYQWSVQSREDILKMLSFFNCFPSRSYKSRRIQLINEYYKLYDLKAYRPDSIHYKLWLIFMEKWEYSNCDDIVHS